ncbi:NADH-quinone oxidoreductase subunit A [bacterium]|nr:NADH-quinone oxidoreductase subunit A [bacterium]
MPYLPLFITILIALIITIAFLLFSILFGPRRETEIKEEPFECGMTPFKNEKGFKFPVKFYLIALLFLVFDIEIAFMFPWAVTFKSLGYVGFIEMIAFVVVLLIGLIYAWKTGALEWE